LTSASLFAFNCIYTEVHGFSPLNVQEVCRAASALAEAREARVRFVMISVERNLTGWWILRRPVRTTHGR